VAEGVVGEEGLVDEIVGLGVGEAREVVLVGEESGDEVGFADADVAVDEAGLGVVEAHVDEGGVEVGAGWVRGIEGCEGVEVDADVGGVEGGGN